MKDYYRNKKFYIDSTNLSIKVEIETKYSYYKNGYLQTDTDYFGSDTIYIYNEYTLLTGASGSIYSSKYIYGAESDIAIKYTVDFGYSNGTIVFID